MAHHAIMSQPMKNDDVSLTVIAVSDVSKHLDSNAQ